MAQHGTSLGASWFFNVFQVRPRRFVASCCCWIHLQGENILSSGGSIEKAAQAPSIKLPSFLIVALGWHMLTHADAFATTHNGLRWVLLLQHMSHINLIYHYNSKLLDGMKFSRYQRAKQAHSSGLQESNNSRSSLENKSNHLPSWVFSRTKTSTLQTESCFQVFLEH